MPVRGDTEGKGGRRKKGEPYLVLDLSPEPYREVVAVLLDAVLVAGREQALEDVGVVPVRPHPRLGQVIPQELVRPEGRGRFPAPTYSAP